MAAGFDCISHSLIRVLTVYDTVYLTSTPPVYQQYTNSISHSISQSITRYITVNHTVYHSESHSISQ